MVWRLGLTPLTTCGQQAEDPSGNKPHVQQSVSGIQASHAEHGSAQLRKQEAAGHSASRQSDELSPLPQPVYHDSAGSLPAEQRSTFTPVVSLSQRQPGARRPPAAAAGRPAGAPIGAAAGAAGPGAAAEDVDPSYQPRVSFSDDVPLSPFERHISAHKQRQIRHSIELPVRPASLTLDDASFQRDRQSNRRCAPPAVITCPFLCIYIIYEARTRLAGGCITIEHRAHSWVMLGPGVSNEQFVNPRFSAESSNCEVFPLFM